MKLQVHTIKAARGAKHSVKRIGRGNASGHGTSSTRGGKGRTARSGGSRGLQLKSFKQLLQSTPKLRGFHSQYADVRPAEVYLSALDKNFNAGETVDLKSLIAKNLIKVTSKSAKILDKGDLTKKLIVVGLKASKSATEKIVKVGGELKK